MDNFINKGIPPLTSEQIKRLDDLAKMSYDEIDLSDIPEITKDEWTKFKPTRLRKKNLKQAS